MATPEGIENAAQRRASILDRIRASILDRGYPPTAGELAKAENVHRSHVQVDLGVLADAGLIEVDRGVQRGIRLAGHRIVLVAHENVPA